MIAYVFQKYPEYFAFQLFIIFKQFIREICYFLKKQPSFCQFLKSFLLINKTLQLNNLKKTTTVTLMQKFQCLLFVLNQSYVCYYIICMTVPLSRIFNLFKIFSQERKNAQYIVQRLIKNYRIASCHSNSELLLLFP